MNKKVKIILYILGAIIIGYLIFSCGVFSGKKLSSASLIVPIGETSESVKGWWIFLEGEIEKITPDYLTLISENGLENFKVNATSATICRSQISNGEIAARMKANPDLSGHALIFEAIKLADLRKGDILRITAMENQNEYLALQISRLSTK